MERIAKSKSLIALGTLVAVAVSAWSATAKAAEIVDQSDASGFVLQGRISGIYPKTGENFTPSLTGIDFADFWLYGNGSDGSGDVEVTSASNGGGSVLGTTNVTSWTASQDGPLEFDFPTTVALTAGTPYSLVFQTTSGTPMLDYTLASGGFLLGNPSSSFYFAEGVGSPVPEPASISLLAVGVTLLLGRRKK